LFGEKNDVGRIDGENVLSRRCGPGLVSAMRRDSDVAQLLKSERPCDLADEPSEA
jgi:hypothetical protein